MLDGKHAQQNSYRNIGDQAQDLDRDHDMPQIVGIHGDDRCRTGHRAAPGQQVHHAHAGTRQAEQNAGVNLHLLVHGVQGGNGDEHRGGGGAVQVGNGGDDGRCHRDRDDVVARQLDQLLHNDIKHARVAHDTKIDDRENEQNAVACGGLDAVLDEIGDLNGAKAQQQRCNGGDQCQHHDGRHLPFQQQKNDCNDHCKANKCYHNFTFSSSKLMYFRSI